MGVEQEAAVVVGADAVRSGRRVGLRDPQRHPGLTVAQRLARGRRPPMRRGRPARPRASATPRVRTPGRWQVRRRARPGRCRSRPRSPGRRPRRPRAGSAGWPRQRPAGEQVQVGVEHGLAGVGPGVEHEPVAVVGPRRSRPGGPARPARRPRRARRRRAPPHRAGACAVRRARAAGPAGSRRGRRPRRRSRRPPRQGCRRRRSGRRGSRRARHARNHPVGAGRRQTPYRRVRNPRRPQ